MTAFSDAFRDANAVMLAEAGQAVILHLLDYDKEVRGIYSEGHEDSRIGGANESRGGVPIRPSVPTLEMATADVEADSLDRGHEVTIAGQRYRIISHPRDDGTGMSVMELQRL